MTPTDADNQRPPGTVAVLSAFADLAAEWSIIIAGVAVSVAGGISEARHAVADGIDLEVMVAAAARWLSGC